MFFAARQLVRVVPASRQQANLAEYGFRSPVDEPRRDDPRFGAVEELFTLETLGGALRAEREILEAVWRQQILPQLDAAVR